MSGFGTTPTTTGQGILATNQFPIAEVYVPNTTNGNLTALQGGTSSTDGNGNASAPVMAQLAAGSAVVGHVIVDSAGAVSVVALPALPAGTNAIGTVGVTSLPTLPAGTNVIGHVIVDSAGSVSVTSLPSLPAGTNLIGGTQLVDSAGTNKASVSASGAVKVDGSATTQPVSLASLPTLPAGTNVIGHVIVDSAGLVSITSLPSLPAGTNVIGHVIVDSAASVSVTSLPALPAGSNAIGSVTISNANANGQALMANSAPVVLASDQTAISTNMSKVNGTTLSYANPLFFRTAQEAAAFAGEAFCAASSENFYSGTSGNVGITLFNPSTSKNIVIYRILVWNESNSNYVTLNKITTYNAFDTPISPVNQMLSGGAASALTSSNISWSQNAPGTVTGTVMLTASNLQGDTKDMLAGTAPIILPASANTGIACYYIGTSMKVAFTIFWYEY